MKTNWGTCLQFKSPAFIVLTVLVLLSSRPAWAGAPVPMLDQLVLQNQQLAISDTDFGKLSEAKLKKVMDTIFIRATSSGSEEVVRAEIADIKQNGVEVRALGTKAVFDSTKKQCTVNDTGNIINVTCTFKGEGRSFMSLRITGMFNSRSKTFGIETIVNFLIREIKTLDKQTPLLVNEILPLDLRISALGSRSSLVDIVAPKYSCENTQKARRGVPVQQKLTCSAREGIDNAGWIDLGDEVFLNGN